MPTAARSWERGRSPRTRSPRRTLSDPPCFGCSRVDFAKSSKHLGSREPFLPAPSVAADAAGTADAAPLRSPPSTQGVLRSGPVRPRGLRLRSHPPWRPSWCCSPCWGTPAASSSSWGESAWSRGTGTPGLGCGSGQRGPSPALSLGWGTPKDGNPTGISQTRKDEVWSVLSSQLWSVQQAEIWGSEP